jgi:hypothetical protein
LKVRLAFRAFKELPESKVRLVFVDLQVKPGYRESRASRAHKVTRVKQVLVFRVLQV